MENIFAICVRTHAKWVNISTSAPFPSEKLKSTKTKKHRKNCESCPTKVTWKVKFVRSVCPVCPFVLVFLSALMTS